MTSTDALIVLLIIPAVAIGQLGGWIIGTKAQHAWWNWRNPDLPPVCRCWFTTHLKPYCPRNEDA